MSTQLSETITLEQATFSATAQRLGIDNSVTDPEMLTTLKYTAARFERVSLLLMRQVHIDSMYRCLELNRALGSSDKSQHVKGQAVDFICPEFGTPMDIVKKLSGYAELLDFDQLIQEFGWVHISFIPTGGRRQILTLLKNKHYAVGITDPDGNPA